MVKFSFNKTKNVDSINKSINGLINSLFSKKMLVMILFMMLFLVSGVVNIVNASDFAVTLLNQEPDPALPGQNVEVRWKVEKLTNLLVKDVRYELVYDYPFSLDPGQSAIKELGNWGGNTNSDEFYTLFYRLRVDEDAIEDTYKVKIKASHGSSDATATNEYEIRVGEKKQANLVLGTIISDPTKLASDVNEAELSIAIENIGDGNADNVKAQLVLPDGFESSYSYSEIDTMGTIEAGEGKNAVFYIDTSENLKGGTYPTEIIISYKDAEDDDNVLKVINLPLNLQVKSKPKFDIENVETIPEKIIKGSSVQLKFFITNVGDETAESVSIRAFKESSQPFEFDEKSDFIGKLEPGQTGEAVLKLNVDEDANIKEYFLDIEIRAIQDDEVLIYEKTASLDVVNSPNNNIDELIEARKRTNLFIRFGIPVLVVLVGLIIGFYIGRKTKKRK